MLEKIKNLFRKRSKKNAEEDGLLTLLGEITKTQVLLEKLTSNLEITFSFPISFYAPAKPKALACAQSLGLEIEGDQIAFHVFRPEDFPLVRVEIAKFIEMLAVRYNIL